MWAYESVFYQIYPLGFCGAPFENDHVTQNRIAKVIDWIPHLNQLHVNALYFSPVFLSSTHGYDTADFNQIDNRLGTDDDFKKVCDALHQNGIKIVLDGVFNHVGREFWAFVDVLKNRENSPYKDWFNIHFDGNSNYNDGLWYEGWEGHYELVKLNLNNEQVVQYLFDCIKNWVSRFDIDGLRLDVAYLLPSSFLTRLRSFCDGLKSDFFLIGEMIHGDYNQFVSQDKLHSCTNYECYKGLYSSFNSYNLFEICHSLGRQFGNENWTLYKQKHLMCFVDNHDVSRIASMLTNENHLPGLYALLFGMPGIPCLYYGSEWGAKGDKGSGDLALRPNFDAPVQNQLFHTLSLLAKVHADTRALWDGGFEQVALTNRHCAFVRQWQQERVLVCINADENPHTFWFNGLHTGTDLLNGDQVNLENGYTLPGYGFSYLSL